MYISRFRPSHEQTGRKRITSRFPTNGKQLMIAKPNLDNFWVVGIDIEGEINGARAVAQLSKLVGVEMGAKRTGEVLKSRLPQHET
jgi:hypothetical protein